MTTKSNWLAHNHRKLCGFIVSIVKHLTKENFLRIGRAVAALTWCNSKFIVKYNKFNPVFEYLGIPKYSSRRNTPFAPATSVENRVNTHSPATVSIYHQDKNEKGIAESKLIINKNQFKMKKLLLILGTALCLFAVNKTMAQDFIVNSVYYSVISSYTVEVTNNNNYSGNLIIPSTVTNDSATYSVISIIGSAFETCHGLISLTIPNSVISIGSDAFFECDSLISLTISNSITTIEERVFAGCSSLGSVIIPNLVTTIKGRAFADCSSLTSVTIPNSVTTIEEEAFANCSGLTEMYVKATTPPLITQNSFSNVPTTIRVHVPCKSETVYKHADGWNAFSNIIGDIPLYGISVQSNDTAIGTVNITQANTCTNDTAIINAMPKTACRFLKWNDGITDNPRTITVTSDTVFTAIFDILYSVNILQNSDTMGTVIGNGMYPKDSATTISAIANSGFCFLKWNDGNTDNPRTITVISDTAFTAIFEIAYTVTVSENDNTWGMVSGSGDYPKDSTATISATANADCRFLEWNDGITDNPRTITVVSDTVFTAIFNMLHSVSILKNNDTMGIVIGNGMYFKDSTTTISAIANANCRFLKWNDDITDNPRNIILTSDTVFTAIFEIMHTVNITVNDNTMGAVIGEGIFPKDSIVTIGAIPNDEHSFLKWNDGNTDNPRTITLISDTNFIAEFEILYQIELLLNSDERGFVAGAGDYAINTTVTIGAIANSNYYFAYWNDGNTNNPRTITVTQDTVFIATFDIATAIENIETADINIYPNPAKDNINIHLQDNVHQAVFTLYDVQGKLLIRKEIGNQDAVSVSNLTTGLYIYNVKTEKQNYQGKVVISSQ
ncbi:MAG: leucine-rich repeat protein [Bacteroidales bacterium]|jgi:hypothetical protein|nr:leucine-rich repeat protein [Bacteroidales bacterium]